MAKRTHEEAERTRQAILESAFRLFSRRGYESTSLSDIARFANVTRGAIYWHFKDKGDILVEICENFCGDSNNSISDLDYIKQAADPKEQDPLGKLKMWLLRCNDNDRVQFFSSALFGLVGKIMSGACGSDNVRERLAELFNKQEAFVQQALENAVQKKQLPADLNVALAAEMLGVFFCGYITFMRDGNAKNIQNNFNQVVDIIFGSMLHGDAGSRQH